MRYKGSLGENKKEKKKGNIIKLIFSERKVYIHRITYQLYVLDW